MDGVVLALVGVIALVVGALIGYAVLGLGARDVRRRAREAADLVREQAESRAREIELNAQQGAIRYREEIDEELREQRQEAQRVERRLEQREESLERRAEGLERSEQGLRDRTAGVDQREAGLKQQEQQLEGEQNRLRDELERLASMSADEARELLLSRLDDELHDESARRVRAMEAATKSEADMRARKILATVMQRMTSEITAEATVSVVPIPSDELKGRIIGREGRNIRAFEAATGCDLLIDDTPEVVTVVGFEPVRREIARVALARLVQDGRIQPSRIEEAVDKAREEVERMIVEAGEQAIVDAEVATLHPEIIKTLGRLRFRYSYGQNQLRHCIETSWLAVALAHELGADVEIARIGGLLHDLGKAVDREMEGTHAALGAEIARRFGVGDDIVHCIAAHHEEIQPETTESLIVIIADAMSGSRPGARRDSIEQYVKRLEALEAVANSFDGVDQSFAIQAGREIRVLVQPERIDDLAATRLARDVSRKIEETLQYPGQIKVTVVRETRATSVAR
jgi:ribonuclease Y